MNESCRLRGTIIFSRDNDQGRGRHTIELSREIQIQNSLYNSTIKWRSNLTKEIRFRKCKRALPS